MAAAAGRIDEGILRMAESEFDLAKEGRTATAGHVGQRGPAPDAPARRPITPVKKPDAAPLDVSHRGKRKWDQSWSTGQGALNSKWAKPCGGLAPCRGGPARPGGETERAHNCEYSKEAGVS